MTTRSFPRTKAIKFKWNDLLIEHRHQPAHRAHKTFARLAPVHIFRPVERTDFFWQKFCKNFGGSSALLCNLCGKVFAVRSCNFFQLCNINASFFGEGMSRRSRLAIFECDTDRRPGELFRNIWLRCRYARSNQRQTAWSVKAFNRFG